MARCRETGQTVKSNDLSAKFSIIQRRDAEQQSRTLAEQMKWKTGLEWTGFVQEYSVKGDGRTSL